ncbi:MAG: hypothetical protein KF757_02060 [Phycisphaeraceae bacterium]|nr:hypothetical protein [Phycisphaeraceae bacterium]MCW5761996.1 hypothetical protein [Phycisphaeraceae bacterium]
MAPSANPYTPPKLPRAPCRPRWGLVALLSLVLAGDTMWWVMMRPQDSTLIPDLASNLLGMRHCNCASRRSEVFFGWYDEQGDAWRFDFNGWVVDDPPWMRVRWSGYFGRSGLWGTCSTGMWSMVAVGETQRLDRAEFMDLFDKAAAAEVLAWISATDTNDSGRSVVLMREAIEAGSRQGSPATTLATTHHIQGRTGNTYYPTTIAHDTIMGCLAATWLALGVLSVRRSSGWRREKIRRRRACCGSCGYELVGLPLPLCPECGRDNGRGEAIGRSGRYTGPDAPS